MRNYFASRQQTGDNVRTVTIPRFTPRVDTRPVDTAWPQMPWPPASDVRLCGRFVELSQADPDRDADELFAALDHDAVWQHVAGRPTDAAGYAKLIETGYAAGRLPWTVRLTSDRAGLAAGTVVGMSSYLDVSASDARLEIGFTAYTPAVWAGVVNPETKLLLLSYAFDTLGAGRVQLKTDVRNVRSQQAIARLGAQFEGVFRRYQRRSDDTMRDTVFFSILAEEWPAARAALIARLDGA
ncbi:MAG TPA: GNAT family protein [Acidothermaceae bacterium]|jgi:RimJ/RimL family protein N-acetyltransferase|nr:GNAT family protein [Acidothermaceae bacterium]